MPFHWKAAWLAGPAALALSAGALAQNPPRPPADQPSAVIARTPVYDPRQLPALQGRVRQFTLTPRGDIDGLILTDDTEVDTPPYLSTQIAYAIRPGDPVTIHGLHAAVLPLEQAVSITDTATGHTVIDNGPPAPPAAPPPPLRLPARPGRALPGLTQVQSHVRVVLHGPQGEVNGALLDDGTILRLPPAEAYRFAGLLRPGRPLVAEGLELVTAMGRVMDARQIGAARNQLTVIDTPPLPGTGGPPPPPAPGSGPPGPPPP